MINQELTSCCWSPLEVTGNIVKQVEDDGNNHVMTQPQLQLQISHSDESTNNSQRLHQGRCG